MTDTSQECVAVFDRHDEQVRVLVGDFKGQRLTHIRTFFKRIDGPPLPTKKGVTFKSDQLPKLIAALQIIEGTSNAG